MKTIRSMALLLICCVGISPTIAGTISGITVGLDGIEPLGGVNISARRIGVTGIRENTVFVRTVSEEDGTFIIDVGNTPVVELLFQNGPKIRTFLQRLGGLNDMTGLVVVAPFSLIEEQDYPPCGPKWFDACGRPVAQRSARPIRKAVVRTVSKAPEPAMRQWTSQLGQTTTAKLVQVVGTKAYFLRVDGKRAASDRSKLSATDQRYIKTWLESERFAKRTR